MNKNNRINKIEGEANDSLVTTEKSECKVKIAFFRRSNVLSRNRIVVFFFFSFHYIQFNFVREKKSTNCSFVFFFLFFFLRKHLQSKRHG